MIGKAVVLSEAIARSDRGPLPKLKEMVRNFKIEQVTDEISGALEKMNEEIMRSSEAPRPRHPLWRHLRKQKTPEQRREQHRVKGTVSFFTGIGITIFLFSVSEALVLKLPPEDLARIPFELQPVVHALWTVGLIPTLAGLGHLVGSFFIKSTPAGSLEAYASTQQSTTSTLPPYVAPANISPPMKPSSVTEHTTNLLASDPIAKDA